VSAVNLNSPHFPVRVFYDGSCSVCAAEIEHYLSQNHGGRLTAIDIRASDFDPTPFGISLEVFMYELHVIDRSDKVYRGVEAFWAIWQAFPASTLYWGLGTIVTMPLINPLARLFYKWFARFRRFLPKRHNCRDGACRIDSSRNG
jgi:predicted DCC family thiol-disulfide oxidoreductase YuxK